MIGLKVVRVTPDGYRSVFAQWPEYAKSYTLGKPVEDAAMPMFFFMRDVAAYHVACVMPYRAACAVLEVEVENVRGVGLVPAGEHDFAEFWQTGSAPVLWPAPSGTLTAARLTPLRVLWQGMREGRDEDFINLLLDVLLPRTDEHSVYFPTIYIR